MDLYNILNILQPILHYSLHLLFPGLIAWIFYRDNWKKVWLILIATMLIDLDHLFATPIYNPERCSIGFHFLHSYYAIVIYVAFLFIPKMRIIGIGLVLHILTDLQDCFWTQYIKSIT